jgi:hypothetical protein
MFKFHNALLAATALLLVACGGDSASGGSNQGDTHSEGSGFYLPFVATSTSGGETGLLVIPSDNLQAKPIFVTSTTARSQTDLYVVGYSQKLTLNSSHVITAVSPYALLYVGVGGDGNAHIYALRLADTSVAPSATQISGLSLSSAGNLCSIVGAGQTNVYDPTTMFVVLHTNAGGASSCDMGGDVYQVVHYTDTSTTAPTVVDIATPAPAPASIGSFQAVPFPTSPISTTPRPWFTPLYRSDGTLGGVVLLDSRSGNLNFYANDAFSNPTVLMSGVTNWRNIVDDSSVRTASAGASTTFLEVGTISGTSLWRVTAAGTAEQVVPESGFHSFEGVADTHNVYLADTAFPSGNQKIYQEAISGGIPLELYSAIVNGPPQYSLVGSSGTLLVLTSTVSDTSVAAGQLVSVLTLPVDTPASSTSIFGPFFYYQGMPWSPTSSMCPSTFGEAASDEILLTTATVAPGSGGSTSPGIYTYSSEVLTPGGVVRQAVLDNSTFLINGLPGTCGVLQVRGITDTNGYGGGTLNAFNLSSFSATPLTTATGSTSYVVPAGASLHVSFLSDVVGSGVVGPPGAVSSGLAFDLSKSLIVTVSVPNSSVSVVL